MYHTITNLLRMRLHRSQNDTVSTQPPSETTVNSEQLPPPVLPEELIFDILLQLPVRSLLQFKCVCKSWKTLLSNSQFINNHLLNSTAYPQLFSSTVKFRDREIVSYPVKPLFENPSTPIKHVTISMRHKYNILGSCNGLICLYDARQSNFRLWNPSIKLKSNRFPIVASFDNQIFTYHGFGYDRVNDKYKLLVVVLNKYDFSKKITRVYTFGENSWTTVQNFPCNPGMWLGKFVSGTLNWIVDKDDVNSNQRAILSFDLENETSGEVLLRQHHCYDGYGVCNHMIYVLSNCLCVCFDRSETHLTVWMMKEYGVVESWTILMIIPYEKFNLNCLSQPYVDPLFVSKDRVLLVSTTLSKFLLYNINNGRIDYARILGILGREVHIYHESLVSPF